MSRLAAGTVALCCVFAVVAGAPVLTAGQQEPSVQTPAGFDETTFRVTVSANGSAIWAIEHQTPLRNQSERDQFEAFATEFERTETDLYLNFVDQATVLTRFGTNATGREMTATGFQRSAAVDPVQSAGTVRMSFRWSNFARVSGDRVIVNDVFDGGFYIGPSQSFVFERGPTLAFVDARPEPNSMSQPDSLAASESVTWNGERSFNDQRPYVEYGPRSSGQPTTAPPQSGGDTATLSGEQSGGGATATPAESGVPTVIMGLVLLAIAIGIGGVVAWRSGLAGTFVGRDDDGGAASSSPSTAQSPEMTTQAETAEPADQEPAVADEELLSDSDRVRKLLEENGGRMKQVNIVDNTDWSKSKVSMLLSDMEEEGTISKLRVGRENIISLSGNEPDAAGSPFDDE